MTKDVKELAEAAVAWVDEKEHNRALVLITFDNTVKSCDANYTVICGDKQQILAGLGTAMLTKDSPFASLMQDTTASIVEFLKYRDRQENGQD